MVSGSSWALFRPPPCTSDGSEMCPESLLLLLPRRRAPKRGRENSIRVQLTRVMFREAPSHCCVSVKMLTLLLKELWAGLESSAI